jgi:hypothetical protein
MWVVGRGYVLQSYGAHVICKPQRLFENGKTQNCLLDLILYELIILELPLEGSFYFFVYQVIFG